MLRVTDHFDEIERLKIENGQSGLAIFDGVAVTARFSSQSGVTMHFNDEATGARFFTLSGIDTDKIDVVAQVVVTGIDAHREEERFVDAHDPRHEALYNKIHTPFT